MLSFHNDPKVKEKYLKRVRRHRLADEIVKGHYWENGKGCAVGCTLHSGNHSAYEAELGIPVWLAHLEDALFESMPCDSAVLWPERFLAAIPVGVDLRPAWPHFCIWLMDFVEPYMLDASISRTVKDLHIQVVQGQTPQEADWAAARAAAWAAAGSAAWAAAKAAARSAAWAAAGSAAGSAAWSTARAAAGEAAATSIA
jgi:hypothetical protein